MNRNALKAGSLTAICGYKTAIETERRLGGTLLIPCSTKVLSADKRKIQEIVLCKALHNS